MIRKLGWWLAPVLFATGMAASAQDKPAGYPERPIRILIGVMPGGGADMIARMTGQILTDRWGQNVVIDPRPGGGGTIVIGLAAKAAPDGYTLYQTGSGVLLQRLTKRSDIDVLKTFEPIVFTTSQPYILLVNPNLPAKSVKDLIALSAVRPLTYAGSSGSIGGTVHLGMEQLALLSGMRLKHIAYKGDAPSILALMGGEINMSASSALTALAAAKTGKVRALATLGLKRLPLLPDLPTVAEQGLPGFSITNTYVLLAPARTPQAIITAINRVVSEGMNGPEMVRRIATNGGQVLDPMSPREVRVTLERKDAELQQTVRQIGLTF